MSRYSEDLKQSVLRRMMPPESRSVAELSRETGITETTLYNWRKVAREAGSVMPGGGKRKADDWDSAAKFAVVLETAGLNEEGLAAYCRSKGLYIEQVRAWRAACAQANARRDVEAADQAQRHKADRRRIKELERELHRKEKALAEAAALLVLAKKYRALPQQDEDV
ncbi:MAG: transposase [Gammaproteobacteria bacterium]|nr:transposase [Gammaproteobacteria bacterium]